jgi:hypothetical protein
VAGGFVADGGGVADAGVVAGDFAAALVARGLAARVRD